MIISLAIKDYQIQIKPFDVSKPDYLEVDIQILFHNMIDYVCLNVNNV